MENKIVPCIWFSFEEGKILPIISYYEKIFDDEFKILSILPLGDTPDGYGEMCEVKIFGEKYTFMNTKNKHHDLNDAVSFIINCENQNEIDKFWNYFTLEGEESQCGWCIDKYGLRFQIIPNNLDELMKIPNSWDIMMNQKKIIISEYKYEKCKGSFL